MDLCLPVEILCFGTKTNITQKTRLKNCYASLFMGVNFHGQVSTFMFETKQSVVFFIQY